MNGNSGMMEKMFPGLGESMREAAQDFRDWADTHVYSILEAIGENTEQIKGLRTDLAMRHVNAGEDREMADRKVDDPCADC